MDIQIEMELQEILNKLTMKVIDLSKLQDSGIGVEEELVGLEFEGSSLNTFSDLYTKLDFVESDIDADQPLQLKMEKLESNKKRAEDLYRRLIEVELDCLQYNLPKLDQFKELGEYEEELKKYMKSWKDEAKLKREKGYKNFKDFLQQVDESFEGLNTCAEVRFIVMDTGARLTRLLVDFLFLGLPTTQKLAKRLELVRTELRCLSVEDTSIIFNIVLDILQVAEGKAMEENLMIKDKDKASTSEGIGSSLSSSSSSSYMSREEGDIFRKILREFVRLEISFCLPSLPFKHTNDILLHLADVFKAHSEERLNWISCKIGELKKVDMGTKGDVEDLTMNQLKLIFSSTYIEDKWWDLDLKPNEDGSEASKDQ